MSFVALVSLVAVTALGLAALALPRLSPAPVAPTSPDGATSVVWPDGLQGAARAAITAEAYSLRPGTEPGAWTASNPANSFDATFSTGSVTVATDDRAPVAGLTMAVTGLGRPGALAPPAPATLHAQGGAVDYRRGPLVEWYRNDPRGVEQGFTLAQSPPGDGPLVVEVTLSGALTPRLATYPTGDAVELVDANGDTALRYDHLAAYDDAGTTLDSRLQLDGDTVSLVVDDTGAAYPVVIDPLISTQQAKLTADDPTIDDGMGASVAIDGDTAVVGAPNAYDLGIDTRIGAAYVFVRTGTTWAQQAKLVASDGDFEERFGGSVSISGDTVVVGAANENIGASEDIGAAYVFERTGTTWAQQAKLMADDPAQGDAFGGSVAVLGDSALIGADTGDKTPGSNTGAAYVFERTGASWAQQAKLTASDAAAHDRFGDAVALSGTTAVIGAPLEDDAGSAAGAAYIFEQTGASWAQQAKLTAEDGSPNDNLGSAVTVFEATAVIGAKYDDIDAATDAGSAYVFERAGTDWIQQARLNADDVESNGLFGMSVALSGETTVVGGVRAVEPASGVAYVFERTGGTWPLVEALTSDDGTTGDGFGESVAIDDETFLIGAPRVAASEEETQTGAAYVFVAEPAGIEVDFDGATSDGVGRELQMTATVTCPAGATFNLFVVVEQGDVRAKATVKSGTCTGAPQPFDLVARARVGQTFVAGTAEACGRIEISEPGQGVTDRVTICEDVTVSIP